MNVIGPGFAHHQLSAFQPGEAQRGLLDTQARNTNATSPASGAGPAAGGHVTANATNSMTSQQPAPVAAQVPTTASVPGDVAETQTKNSKADNRAVVEVDADGFKRFRRSELSAELSTSLVLELTTKEGDSVRLDFDQLDLPERSSFRGRTLEGERTQSRSL